tara:strand:+ start:189 stop:494 length:306 start_codon:yes stop_codon:yes gene_type:complete
MTWEDIVKVQMFDGTNVPDDLTMGQYLKSKEFDGFIKNLETEFIQPLKDEQDSSRIIRPMGARGPKPSRTFKRVKRLLIYMLEEVKDELKVIDKIEENSKR